MAFNEDRQILSLTDSELEDLIKKWLAKVADTYVGFERPTASADMGRDAVGFLSARRYDGDWHNYQCKHLKAPLGKAEFVTELGEIFHYADQGEFTLPTRYIFVCPNSAVRDVKKVIDRPSLIADFLINHWDAYCLNGISTTPCMLTPALTTAIRAYAFENVELWKASELVEKLQMRAVLHEHLDIDPGEAPRVRVADVPDDVADEESVYVTQLVAVFAAATQAFNTTTSMGRLTLNVLLSFAQFEREVTGERIRDKVAASKRKRLWMGGPVPLGYQVIERKLVPLPEKAKRVRTIMHRYLEIHSVPALLRQLRDEGVLTKVQNRASGLHRGGIPFARGSLFYLLKNPVYRGKIVHKGQVYDGEHEAIADEDLWERVQLHLRERAPPRKRSSNEPQRALLQGLLFDPEGRPMVPTYGSNGTRRYTYYVSRKDLTGPGDPKGTRFQRGLLESHIVRELSTLLFDEHALRKLSGSVDASLLQPLFRMTRLQGEELARPHRTAAVVRAIIAAVHVTTDALHIELHPAELGIDADNVWSWHIPRPARKPFREAKLRLDAVPPNDRYDIDLVALLAEAMEVQRLVLAAPELSLNQLGKREGRCRTHLRGLLQLSWLSPRIVEAIASGSQPMNLTRKWLLSGPIPVQWEAQERHFGLAA